MDRTDISSSSKALASKKKSGYRDWPVYLYVPNIIGYMRIVLNCYAFKLAFSNENLFVIFYLFSFICDEFDGRFARMLNQTSRFGACLDMITDRVSTAALLVLLTHVYKDYALCFLALFALDISSHWLQMYSSLLTGEKKSHKDMADSKIWILSAYYKYRYFMGFCAIGSEVLYIVLYLIRDPAGNLRQAIKLTYLEKPILLLLGLIAAPGWFIKQFVNVVQMKAAADVTVEYDKKQDLKAES